MAKGQERDDLIVQLNSLLNICTNIELPENVAQMTLLKLENVRTNLVVTKRSLIEIGAILGVLHSDTFKIYGLHSDAFKTAD